MSALFNIGVALNQVDKMIAGGWDEKLNAPTRESENEIERRCLDIFRKFSEIKEIENEQLEYYSALKRFRLLPLLSKIISNARAGFKMASIKPADPFELADEDVRAFIEEEREKKRHTKKTNSSTEPDFILELEKILSKEDLEALRSKFMEESKIPPKVAVLGKAGVGKTTTINNLFNVKWKTSPTNVGTTEAQTKNFKLTEGVEISITDLPGYGRSISEDKEYEKIYKEVLPKCDLILLVLQADSRDFKDDQEMLLFIIKLLKTTKNTNQ